RGLVEFLAAVADRGSADGLHVVTIFGECLASPTPSAGSGAVIRDVFQAFTEALGSGAAPGPPAPAEPPPAPAPPPKVEAPAPTAATRPAPPASGGKPRGVRVIRPTGAPPPAGAQPASAQADTQTPPETDQEVLARRRQQQQKLIDKGGRGSGDA